MNNNYKKIIIVITCIFIACVIVYLVIGALSLRNFQNNPPDYAGSSPCPDGQAQLDDCNYPMNKWTCVTEAPDTGKECITNSNCLNDCEIESGIPYETLFKKNRCKEAPWSEELKEKWGWISERERYITTFECKKTITGTCGSVGNCDCGGSAVLIEKNTIKQPFGCW
ncbi:hypothetical protein ACFLZ9_00095 [Patescibacteria group bacterium]